MTTSEGQKKILLVFILSALFLQIAALVPQFRTQVNQLYSGIAAISERSLVAKIDGILKNGEGKVRIIKLFQNGELFLEAYFLKNENIPNLIARVRIGEKRDAFLTIKGSSTNLALQDIDGDGNKEILVPTFNEDLFPRLYVFRLNSESGTFETVELTNSF